MNKYGLKTEYGDGHERLNERSVIKTDESDLPIYVHEFVLGVNIGVNQRDNERIDGGDIRAYGTESYPDSRSRRYLAAWARRNLFN